MKVMSKVTNLAPKEIIDKAVVFFSGKYGLKRLESSESCCAHFQSDIGFVSLRVVTMGKRNEAILETREYDYQIQEFLKTF
ncbi:MAG: hypothetical protein C4K49_02755 [Candidatus Thorarchaeota archaeon]|nr:MAG: hypothetical protein C4K49_02755 [Candidatus Thorarchaeota archaeon]